ncbi:DUF4365 domain-containing protein [Algiphilus sp.]
MSNRTKERIGINTVQTIVENVWESGWQEYAAHNDDAIDGVILLRKGSKKPRDTGGIVFVQVKCGGNGYRQDQAQHPNHIGVALGKHYIDAHRPRWRRTPGPAVLVFVDDTIEKVNPPAWWVDLNSKNVVSPTNEGMLLIPKNQKFSHHSKGDFHRLCGPRNHDRQLERITLERQGCLIPHLGRNESIRKDAWDFFKAWREDADARTSPVLGRLLVNRVGWKHMTRPGRRAERIVQSWMLLGAAKEMVRQCKRVYQLGRAKQTIFYDGNIHTQDYLGLRALVSFPYRHESVVQVILKRSRLLSPSGCSEEREKIWFYSVYELRRGAAYFV